jgi:uncharacterized membrane protein
MQQNRFRSKVVWLSVLSLILLVLNNYGVFDKIGMSSSTAEAIGIGILSILVGFGIINDPTNGSGV